MRVRHRGGWLVLVRTVYDPALRRGRERYLGRCPAWASSLELPDCVQFSSALPQDERVLLPRELEQLRGVLALRDRERGQDALGPALARALRRAVRHAQTERDRLLSCGRAEAAGASMPRRLELEQQAQDLLDEVAYAATGLRDALEAFERLGLYPHRKG